MSLWNKLIWCIFQLRPACSRKLTFLNMVFLLLGFILRNDVVGVTSMIRGMHLKATVYRALVRTLNGGGISLEKLQFSWCSLALKIFSKQIFRCNGRLVLLGDGLKIPKEGRKIPAVKSQHQESSNNSKPEFIMGHFFQTVALLTTGFGRAFATPLASRIHDGIRYTTRDRRTVIDKYLSLLKQLSLGSFYLVVDCYYCTNKIARSLVAYRSHLVSRVKTNAVACLEVEMVKIKKRGRPKKYGKSIKLRALFDTEKLIPTNAFIYGENRDFKYWSRDLVWPKYGGLVRYVGVLLPNRSKAVFVTTDLTLEPLKLIELYSLRMKIELSYKVAIQNIGTYAYHLWSKPMDKIKRHSGVQYVHRKTKEYRNAVTRKIEAIEIFVLIGSIAQGLLQYLALTETTVVWQTLNTYFRTLNQKSAPTEEIVREALKSSYLKYLVVSKKPAILRKFFENCIDQKQINSRYGPIMKKVA